MAVLSKNKYILPVFEGAIEYVVTDGPGHPVPYDKAIDYAVPIGTEVLAPCDGEVITVVDGHTQYGADVAFADKCNYVQIRHAHGEISDLMHLARGSVDVKVGQKVKQNQLIAKTGLSGFMTAPHLHWMVFRHADNPDKFEGLAPIFTK